ncbi:MAG: choice-of-anchor D domain-containing protein [Luteolibacter sp.]|uniref:choice-of-anchor D domain-containing protein n=1 Tax=Luteolibacter sp. TaxID=1962973 RepID=UPI003266B1C2
MNWKSIPSSIRRAVHLTGIVIIVILIWNHFREEPTRSFSKQQVDHRHIAQLTATTCPSANPSLPSNPDSIPPTNLTGEAANEALGKNGQYESLGAAFSAARHAVDKIDPAGPNSRGAEYFAINPEQQLRTWFGKGGIEFASGVAPACGSKKVISPATFRNKILTADMHEQSLATEASERAPWNLALRLHSAGRSNGLKEVRLEKSYAAGNRVEMTDSVSGLIQWFENRREGVEQGFTIIKTPVGSGFLEMVMAIEGNLKPERLTADAVSSQGVRFVDAEGNEVIQYKDIKACDADGQSLVAKMEIRGADLALVVDDAGARYPLTIDPLFVNVEKRLTDDPVAFDKLGFSVALSGDTALLGAPEDETGAGLFAGSAYVFVRNGTTWLQQAKLTASNAAAFDNFGHAVAISGNTALVGAYFRDTPAGANAGNAYVFVRNGTTWSQQAELKADDGAAGDVFGLSVALSDNTAVIGAPGADTVAGVRAGSAYVFSRTGNTWTQLPRLTATDGAAGDSFGLSVSVDLDTAVVGAPFDDLISGSGAGSAHVFVRNGSVWNAQGPELTASDGAGDDFFGYAVAVHGNTALVAAPLDDTDSGSDAGSVHVFFRSGTNWAPQGTTLVASDGAAGDNFGFCVSLDGDTAVIGSPNDDTSAGVDAGSAYFFFRSSGSWSQQGASVTPSVFAQEASFGASVSISGDTVLVGVPSDDTSAGTDAGSASVFLRTNTSWNRQAQLTAGDSPAYDYFGLSVSLKGDTALVGAPWDDTMAGADVGSAYVFVRSGSLWNQQARLSASDGASSDHFGISLALSGGTALIGSLNHSISGGFAAGAAYVFVRSGTNWAQQGPPLTAIDGAANDGFGSSVALDGDDALVGAPYNNTPAGADAGSAYVFTRVGATWTQQPKLLANDGAANDSFGYAVALSQGTALVSAVSADTAAGINAGSGYIFVRTNSAWGPPVKLTGYPSHAGADFGYSVALSGDTALVGARLDASINGIVGGAAYVFVRSATAWELQAKLIGSNASESDEFGYSVALEGDSALVGAPGNQTDSLDAGSVYLFERRGAIWSEQSRLAGGVDSSSVDRFGSSISLSGNTALAGAYLEDTAATDAGSVYVFLVGELPEITRQPESRAVIPNVAGGVTFSIEAAGYGPLRYQWRKDGFAISGATGSNLLVNPATLADAGNYDCVVSNIGGIVTSAPATLKVNNLSQFAPSFPTRAPTGSVIVNLTPAGVGGWRFEGEHAWRAAGAVGGLPAGIRTIEFMSVGGYNSPATVSKSITDGGAATFVNGSYKIGPGGSGGLKVILDADGLNAKWRIFKPGTKGDPWRNSNVTLTGLRPGIYHVECKPVNDHITPPPRAISVDSGETSFLSITYPARESPPGEAPKVLPFETVSSSTDLPYAFVGQIRSDLGFSSGFVVKSRNDVSAGTTISRVVATAGHVVFDDRTKSFVGGLQWLLQRDRDAHEPEPLIPRGAHILDDYAAARVGATPGIGNETSQNRDAAALFFSKDAGRGGYGGFLASNEANNEFLLTTPSNATTLKMFVGYPVDGDEFIQGRMYASPPTAAAFSRVAPADDTFRTFRTTALSGAGGMSGGPLCVQFEGGNYLPAAIYLGGTGESIVRAIDGQVVDLIERAEASSATGDNQTGGGFALYSFSNIAGGSSASGAVHVVIFPPSARGGAYWRVNDRNYHQSDAEDTLPAVGAPYTLYVAPVEGFVPPDPVGQPLAFKGGKIQEVTYTYIEAPEIKVSQPSAADLPDSGSRTFGSVAVGAGSPLIFTVRNSGHADLTGLKITKDGANAADFSVTGPAKSVLPPGAKTTFKVTFKPSATGNRKAAIHIASNDADESPFDIILTGRGTAAVKAGLAGAVLPLVDRQSSGGPDSIPRETITTIQLADGRKYLALTVTRTPCDFYQKPRVEVSGNLLDWYSGAKHTTVMADDARRYQARDNIPLAPGTKRYIRLKE